MLMKPYRGIGSLAGLQVVCFLLLTHLEPHFFLLHLYQSILYVGILVLLFYMEDHWAYMIGMLASVVWLGMAYGVGILGESARRLAQLNSFTWASGGVGLVAAVTAVLAVLMIVFCARRWMREYAGLGKARSTFLVSLGIVGAYYGILAAWFWHTTSPAVPVV